METKNLKKHLKKSYDKETLIKIYEKIENPPAYFLEYLYNSSYSDVLIFIIKEYKNYIKKLLKNKNYGKEKIRTYKNKIL